MADDALVLQKFLVCQICQETFRNPVCLECNHSFCKTCLCETWDQDEHRTCPVCERPAPVDEPQINATLQRLTDVFLGNVQDSESPQETVHVTCDKHRAKPTWYCKDEDRVICEGCETLKKHSEHEKIRIKEFVKDIKRTVSLELDELKSQLMMGRGVEESYLLMSGQLKRKGQVAEMAIEKEFESIHELLRVSEEARLEAVRKEAEQKRKIIQREMKIAKGHVHVLTKAVASVQVDLEKDDLAFLKDSNITQQRVQCKLQEPQVMSGAIFNKANHTGNIRYQIWEEMKKSVKYFPVLLDPNTADGWLYISDDMSVVREIRDKQVVPDNPERFTRYVYVLGTQGFSSGEHSWEVDLGKRHKWSVGVAAESCERKEVTFLEPRFGFWTLWMDEENFTVGGSMFKIEKRPTKIVVKLEYEKGWLSFYDSDDKRHIYTYKTGFNNEKVYPFFSTETDCCSTAIKLTPFDLSIVATAIPCSEEEILESMKAPSENASSENPPSDLSASEKAKQEASEKARQEAIFILKLISGTL
ncbi:E3 ubiquitin-protein ligase TRIM35-like [Engraulis encrasicolus]|uniref:E3 ubiquitin-protein ligase TRIM35-like n=1 Tax=Engraulis encrasicolus TaxID=184585 RepID=UPI002FD257E3